MLFGQYKDATLEGSGHNPTYRTNQPWQVGATKIAMMERMNELVFEVVQEADGGYCAECLTESIFTQADSWDELRRSVIEAVNAFYFDQSAPASVRLHLVRDEVLSVA